jgi:putative transposase
MTARKEDAVDHNEQEQVALHRWAVIAEAAGETLTARERGALVRQIAVRAHPHPDGSSRRYSRGTVDRWLRAWRAGGLAALMPAPHQSLRMHALHDRRPDLLRRPLLPRHRRLL